MNLQQPIPWRTRPDLLSVENAAPTTTHYTVKDPVKDEYYYFGQTEYFFLKHLRLPQSFASLIQAAAAELGRKLGAEEIQRYLGRLAKDNLIVPMQLGDARRLYQQRQSEQRGTWKQRILGLLSIKLPGFYPGGILPPLKPVGWLLFNPVSIALFSVAVLVTVLFAIFSWGTLAAKVPPLAALMTAEHVTAVLVGFVIAKILHELGHAVACQHAGRECAEMGVLLLVFLPCLYCDVSDMWTERSKFKRVLVSLAGVFVELGIALLCFWLWFFSVPGPLNYFCYSLMLITSVNTLFINGNPLMRYDGYYALADLTNTHNLGTAARNRWGDRMGQFFLRRPRVVRPGAKSRFLLSYAWGALVYRWLILAVIGFGIWKFFDLQQLRSIGNLVAGLIFVIAAVPLLFGIRKSFRSGMRHGLRWFNTGITVAVVASLIYMVAGLEFSHRIWGRAQMQLASPEHVFASDDGRLISTVADGEQVAANDVVAVIENPALQLKENKLLGELEEARVRLEQFALRSDSHLLAGQLEYWKKRESSLQRQLVENRARQQQLVITSPVSGQFVGFQFGPPEQNPVSLNPRQGSLLDDRNRECQVRRGDPIGYVGNPDRMVGHVAIDQKDIELVRINQTVKIRIPFSDDVVEATVVNISIESESTETRAENAGLHPPPAEVVYRVEIEFDSDPRIRVGSNHQAVLIGQPTTPLAFLGRWLRNSFWF